MHKLVLLPCVALLTAAAPAQSAPPAVGSQIAPSDAQKAVELSGGARDAAVAPEEKKVCKQLPSTGSRLPNRACLTPKEWKQVEQDLEH